MELHEAANIFPLLEGAELEALAADIKEHGLIEPVHLYQSKILDGRNRYLACQKAGVQPRFVDYAGDDPFRFVISLNLKRRHLNESQRAVIAAGLAALPVGRNWDSYSANLPNYFSQPEAAELANMPHGGDRKSDQAANLRLENHISQPEAAKLLNVSERAIQTV